VNRSEQVLVTKDEDAQRVAVRSIDWLDIVERSRCAAKKWDIRRVPGEPLIHSALSAIIGSTRLARRAGIQQARKAIVRSVKAMKVKVIGSEALTP